MTIRNNPVKVHVDNIRTIRSHQHLQESCLQICKEFPDLWKPELGCLKDYSLEVKFKPDVTPPPRFCKPRTVPFAVQEDLNQADDVGIAKGIWKPVTFNEYGTPVVPVRKQSQPNQPSGAVRVCGDNSVFINGQLEMHRQPMPLPEDLMRRLDGTHYFSKVDLADAYNQIELGPESQRRLALSTHRGVLLQMRLPFGISSATGHFQDVMNQLTSDLPGVAVYLDDILISGKTAEDHLNNLRRLLKRLNDRGLRCRIQKCVFAQDSVTVTIDESSANNNVPEQQLLPDDTPSWGKSLYNLLNDSIQALDAKLTNFQTTFQTTIQTVTETADAAYTLAQSNKTKY